MGLSAEQIAVKMRLTGAASYQRQMQRNTATTTEYGAAAERTGAQTKSAAVGIDAMNASAKRGVGSLARLKASGEGMKSLGSRMTSAFTVPIALIGGVGVKSALDFSDSMEQITTQAGATQQEVNRMTKAVMAYAASGRSDEGPNSLAKGLFRIESAGFRGKRALDAMIKSEQLATVGHADFEKTSTAVSAAMASQIEGTQNLNETVGIMNATVGIGNMRFEDLLSAMSTGLLDRAANFGLSLKEVGAALGTMTTVGHPAAASATRMAMAFNMMAAPTDKAKKAMKEIGLNATDMALSLRKRGLIPTLEMLKSHLDATFGTSNQGLAKQANAISEMFGGGRTSGGLVTLMRHTDLLKKKQGELTGVQEKFKTALERTDAQPITKLHKAWSQMQVVLIELGNMLVPVLTDVVQFMTKIFKGFSKLPQPVKTTIIVLSGVLAIFGPLLSLIGTATLGVYALAAAFGALDIATFGIPVLIGAVAAVAVHLTGIFDSASDSGSVLGDTAKRLADGMDKQRTAGMNLVASERHLTKAKKRHSHLAHEVKSAQADLNAVISEYEPKSKPAIHAEQMLAQKRWSLVRATHALKKAHKEHGIALQMTKQLTKTNVLEARHEILGLKRRKTEVDELWLREKNKGATAKRLNEVAELGTHINDRLSGAHKKLNEVLLEASQKIGPKYAKWLQKADRETLQFGEGIELLNNRMRQLREMGGILGGEEPNGRKGTPHLPSAPGQPGVPLHPRRPHASPGTRGSHLPSARTSGVGPVRYRGGPTLSSLENGRYGGGGRGRRVTKVEIPVTLNVSRRKFGEAMASAMIEDEENE